MVGMNLDLSHHMWMGGDGVKMAKALGADATHHVHAKDLRKERECFAANGGLETKFFDDYNHRYWNYVALGFGESAEWWKKFFAVLSMMGYNGPVSLEIEDKTMPALVAIKKSIDFLHEVIPHAFLWTRFSFFLFSFVVRTRKHLPVLFSGRCFCVKTVFY